jgi:hypothetical protein
VSCCRDSAAVPQSPEGAVGRSSDDDGASVQARRTSTAGAGERRRGGGGGGGGAVADALSSARVPPAGTPWISKPKAAPRSGGLDVWLNGGGK